MCRPIPRRYIPVSKIVDKETKIVAREMAPAGRVLIRRRRVLKVVPKIVRVVVAVVAVAAVKAEARVAMIRGAARAGTVNIH